MPEKIVQKRNTKMFIFLFGKFWLIASQIHIQHSNYILRFNVATANSSTHSLFICFTFGNPKNGLDVLA